MRVFVWTILLLSTFLGKSIVYGEAQIDPEQIVTLLPKDAIPAILDPAPLFVSASVAEQEMRENEQVMGVSFGEESHAYPIIFLSWHEIVNDVVGGKAIAVTW